MKKSLVSPMLMIGLALVMMLGAGCNRPDASQPLETPAQQNPQAAQSTLPPVITEAAPSGGTPDLNATIAAGSGVQPPATTPAPVPTQLPAQPAQATPVPTSAPVAVATTPAPTPTRSPTGEIIHTVQLGERLFSIGRLYNVNPYAIAQTNNIAAPYLIYPGQKLKIPSSTGGTPVPQLTPGPGGRTYTVQVGDNLFRISLRFGVSMQAIAAANGITNYNFVYIGQVLKIP